MAAYLIVSKDGGPIVDTDPQDGDGVRSVELKLGERAGVAVDHLLSLTSFEIAFALGALVQEGIRLGSRSPVTS